MPTPKELREEFAKVHAEATKVVDDAISAGTELAAEAKEANEKRFARLETIKNILDNQIKFAKLALEAGEVITEIEPPGKKELEKAMEFAVAGKIDRVEFSRAMKKWAASGDMESKFATITTATQSGILLPVEVSAPIVPSAVNVLRAAFALYGVTPMATPTTAQISIPVLSATAGSQVAENASSETEQEPGLTESIVSTCKTYSSGSAYFSNMALAANDIDIVAYTIPALSYSKELALESTAVAAIIADDNITQGVTTGSNSTLAVADLEGLDQALPKKFQQQKVILLSQTAYAQACALAFSSGPFVLATDANGVRRFNGTPVLRSDYFAAYGASAVAGCIMSVAGFHLRDAGPVAVTRYTQVPAKPNQTGFNLFAYHAYGYAPSAMAKLTCHS